MRKISLLTGLIVLLISSAMASSAAGETLRNYSFFAAGEFGFAATPEEFTDYYTIGYGFSLGMEYSFVPGLSVIGLFDLKLFKPDEGMIADWWDDWGEHPGATNIEVSEGQVTAGSVAILGKAALITPGMPLAPYVKGGFGITISGADEIKVMYDMPYDTQRLTAWQGGVDSETNISIIIGLGAEWKLGQGHTALFLDAGLHVIVQEDVSPTMAPVTLGLKF